MSAGVLLDDGGGLFSHYFIVALLVELVTFLSFMNCAEFS
jgi:hypothetical protein